MSGRSESGKYVLNLAGDEFAKRDGRFTCKFILIEHQDRTWVVLGPIRRYPYHATLVDKFCTAFTIPSAWEHHPDYCLICDPEVETRGGGYLDIDPRRKIVVVSGSSTAYGGFERPLAARVLQASGVFDGYRIDVRHR
jgi:hypothetical protein